MAIFRCKICGGTLEINDNSTVCLCEYCGTKQTLPRLDSEKKINLYDRADHFRRNNDYDKAMSIYESILNEDATDSEAYWSILLCRYGVEYVEDPTTHKHIPTINRAQFTSVLADEDYKSAITYADGNQKEIYEEEAKYIDDVQKGILEISQKEEPYDVFICYKETDSTVRRTKDSVLATDLYHGLTSEGFKVFFSRITLEDKLGTAYEPYIFAALNSAKVMVVIGTKAEYLNSVWVKNEWNRYLALIKSGAKKTLIPAYRDMDPYDLPEEFSHLQAQDMSKLGFMQDIIRGIQKIIAVDEPKSANKETVIVNSVATNIAPLLKRAFMFLEDGEWEKADDFCEQVLNQDPECAQAYLGKLMAEHCVHKKEQLVECKEPFDEGADYQKIIRFADNALIAELKKYLSVINERKALRAKEERKNALYIKAMDLASFDDIDKLQQAIQVFSSIFDWKDSEDKIRKCNERIKQINITNEQKRIKAEHDRIEKERETELRRIENDKRAKKYKKAAKIGFPILAAIIVFVIILTTVIIPTGNYNKALSLMNEGKFENAITIFQGLGNYKDCEIKVKSCKYEVALTYYNDHQYDMAKDLFGQIVDYKDSKDLLNDSKYELAITYYNNSDYYTARTTFIEINIYKDSTIWIAKCAEKIEEITETYTTALIITKGIIYEDGAYAKCDITVTNTGKKKYSSIDVWGNFRNESNKAIGICNNTIDMLSSGESISITMSAICSNAFSFEVIVLKASEQQ